MYCEKNQLGNVLAKEDSEKSKNESIICYSIFFIVEEFDDFFCDQEFHRGTTGNSKDNGPTPLPVPNKLQGFGTSKV